MTYFLGVCIGGVVEMDIWSQIFAEKSNILIKFCVRTDGGGGERGVSQMWAGTDSGEGSQKSWPLLTQQFTGNQQTQTFTLL